ncbi:hypothetical protein Hanom_Chr17g01558461 [Helianthus anomalus]
MDLSRINLFYSKDVSFKLYLQPEDATVNDGRNLMEVNTKKNTRESFTC